MNAAAEREQSAGNAWYNHFESGWKAFTALPKNIQNVLSSTDIVYGYFLRQESATSGQHGTFNVQIRLRITYSLFGDLSEGDELVVSDLCIAKECPSPGRTQQELLFHIRNVDCKPQLIGETSRVLASLEEGELLGLIEHRANLPMRAWAERNTRLWEELNCAEVETQRLFEQGDRDRGHL